MVIKSRSSERVENSGIEEWRERERMQQKDAPVCRRGERWKMACAYGAGFVGSLWRRE